MKMRDLDSMQNKFPYSSFHAEHDGYNYFHVKQLLRKLEGLLQPHVSLFIPPPSPVLSQYIPFYEVRRNIKMEKMRFQKKKKSLLVPTYPIFSAILLEAKLFFWPKAHN